MKGKFKLAAGIALAAAFAFTLSACGNVGLAGKSTLLGSPADFENPNVNREDYEVFKSHVEDFAARFAAYAYEDYGADDNFAVSPVSVYSALALSAECAAGDTREEILGALGVNYGQLRYNYAALYGSLSFEDKRGNTTTGLLSLSNSIWVNKGTEVKQPCIDSLSDNYYAYSYAADFKNDNKNANAAVRDFVKKQTKGLIDNDFQLSDETYFALINALYLKTVWTVYGDDLPFADGNYDFKQADGMVKNIQLLRGDYNDGKAFEAETYSTFFTKTFHGFKIKFILPNDGYTVDDVFTAENIAAVNALKDYGEDDEDTHYKTRVFFPEYKCGVNCDLKTVLHDKFGVDLLFKDSGLYSPSCDFSTVTDDPCHCDEVRHVTTLTVNRKGIEGAAVTVIPGAGDSMPRPSVEADFIVDRAFGFLITDRYDTTLFSGVVKNV